MTAALAVLAAAGRFMIARPRLLAVLALVASAAVVFGAGHLGGREAVREANRRADREAVDAAIGAGRDVAACHDAGGRWDVSTGRCR